MKNGVLFVGLYKNVVTAIASKKFGLDFQETLLDKCACKINDEKLNFWGSKIVIVGPCYQLALCQLSIC